MAQRSVPEARKKRSRKSPRPGLAEGLSQSVPSTPDFGPTAHGGSASRRIGHDSVGCSVDGEELCRAPEKSMFLRASGQGAIQTLVSRLGFALPTARVKNVSVSTRTRGSLGWRLEAELARRTASQPPKVQGEEL